MNTSTTAATYMKAGNIADFTEGSKKKVILKDQEIMLARVGENYYAISNRCPHMGGDLSMGKLEGTIITCPRHHSQFDIREGKVIRWTDWPGPLRTLSEVVKTPHPPKTYRVKVENGEILIEV